MFAACAGSESDDEDSPEPPPPRTAREREAALRVVPLNGQKFTKLEAQPTRGLGPELNWVRRLLNRTAACSVPRPDFDGRLRDHNNVDVTERPEWKDAYPDLPLIRAKRAKERADDAIARAGGRLTEEARRGVLDAFYTSGVAVLVYALEAIFFEELLVHPATQVSHGRVCH